MLVLEIVRRGRSIADQTRCHSGVGVRLVVRVVGRRGGSTDQARLLVVFCCAVVFHWNRIRTRSFVVIVDLV